MEMTFHRSSKVWDIALKLAFADIEIFYYHTEMDSLKDTLSAKKLRLKELLDSQSKANCDTRHLSASDIQREEEIEEVENAIAALEAKVAKGET